MKLKIADIKVGNRIRHRLGRLDSLCQSMTDLGQLQPVGVTPFKTLVFGQRRLEAAKRLGWTQIEAVEVQNLDDALRKLKAERDENTERLELAPSEAVALKKQLTELEKPEAAKRKAQAKGQPRGTKAVSPAKLAGETRERVAEATGFARTTLSKAEAVVDAAKANPALAPVVEEMDRTGNVTKAERTIKEIAREAKRQENAALVAQATKPEEIEGKFAAIVIDPPWDWGDEGDNDQLGRAKPDYATMSIDELQRLPVAKLADDDCHLYMWITNRSLPKGFGLLEAWGFRYITALTWPKTSFGMGNYFRGQTEHVLFGVRGKLPLKRKDASTLMEAWKRGRGGHSSKPMEFLEFVESCSPGPYLEMFNRSERNGWTTWGQSS